MLTKLLFTRGLLPARGIALAVLLAGAASANEPEERLMRAAMCLGETEMSLDHTVVIIQQSEARAPGFGAGVPKNQAATQLSSIARLSQYVSKHIEGSDEQTKWRVLEARQRGIAASRQCYLDQWTIMVPCQNRCIEGFSIDAERDACFANCELPASCTLHDNRCLELEESLKN